MLFLGGITMFGLIFSLLVGALAGSIAGRIMGSETCAVCIWIGRKLF